MTLPGISGNFQRMKPANILAAAVVAIVLAGGWWSLHHRSAGRVKSNATPGNVAPATSHPVASVGPNQSPSSVDPQLNFPPEFIALLEDRYLADVYPQLHHRVAATPGPQPLVLQRVRRVPDRSIVVVNNVPSPKVQSYRQAMPSGQPALRGFRVGLKEEATHYPATLQQARFDEREQRASTWLHQRLAFDGFIPTLARVLEILGPANFVDGDGHGVDVLRKIGFPIDLADCYRLSGIAVTGSHPNVTEIARRLAAGQSVTAALAELAFTFQYTPSGDFSVATETGEHELGMLRLQFGGGYNDGVTPGGTLDMARQLINQLKDTDFVITAPYAMVDPFRRLMQTYSALHRPGQLTIVAEPLVPSAWAQDSGKAGLTKSLPGATAQWVTLAPRYASTGEKESAFMPGDSYLMEGLMASGHLVIASRLLFQGGNVMAVLEPRTKRTVLLVGETEVHRNTALGLTRAEVLAAFTAEFGVDRCLVMPAASFHIDFDMSLRSHQGQLIAFVNDTQAATRLIVQHGIETLKRSGLLTADEGQQAEAAFANRKDAELYKILSAALVRARSSTGEYSSSLARAFSTGASDSPAGNLQCYLLAVELLASQTLSETDVASNPDFARYLAALRRVEARREEQIGILKELGCSIVKVPSMPDFNPSINYLNGIHDPARYLMPAYGGYYSFLDQAARRTFEDALGSQVEVMEILSSESQRQHGAVHCAVAVYPRVAPKRPAGTPSG